MLTPHPFSISLFIKSISIFALSAKLICLSLLRRLSQLFRSFTWSYLYTCSSLYAIAQPTKVESKLGRLLNCWILLGRLRKQLQSMIFTYFYQINSKFHLRFESRFHYLYPHLPKYGLYIAGSLCKLSCLGKTHLVGMQ